MSGQQMVASVPQRWVFISYHPPFFYLFGHLVSICNCRTGEEAVMWCQKWQASSFPIMEVSIHNSVGGGPLDFPPPLQCRTRVADFVWSLKDAVNLMFVMSDGMQHTPAGKSPHCHHSGLLCSLRMVQQHRPSVPFIWVNVSDLPW